MNPAGSQAKLTGPKPGMEWAEATSCVTCGWTGPLLASAYHAERMVCVPCKKDEEARSDYTVFAKLRGREYKRNLSGLGNEAYRLQRADQSWLNVKVCTACGKPPPLTASTVRARKAVCLSCAEKEKKLPNYLAARRLRVLEYGVNFPEFWEEGIGEKQQAALVARRQKSLISEEVRVVSPALLRARSVLSPTAYAPGDLVRYTKSFLKNPGWVEANSNPATVLQVYPPKEGRGAVLMLVWGDGRMVPVAAKDVERVSSATATSRAWAEQRLVTELARDKKSKDKKGSRAAPEPWPAVCARLVGQDLALLDVLRRGYWNDRPSTDKGFGWNAGGCLAFARAFRKVFGGEYRTLRYPEWFDQDEQWVSWHVGVSLREYPGLVFDAEGAFEEAAWFERVTGTRYDPEVDPESSEAVLERGAPRDARKLFAGASVVQAVEQALRSAKQAHGSRAMISAVDLPTGFRVAVETNAAPWQGRVIWNTSIILHEAPSEDFKTGFEVGEIGLDTIHDRANKLWRVGLVESEHGYGPLLYDLAMEYVFLTGGTGLMASREEVSPAASSVWKTYQASRPDVTSRPAIGHHRWTEGASELQEGAFMPASRPWLDRIYAKESAPFFAQLKARGMVDLDRSPPLRRAWPNV